MAAEHRIYSPKWLKTRFSGAKIDQKTNMAVEVCQIFNSLLNNEKGLQARSQNIAHTKPV